MTLTLSASQASSFNNTDNTTLIDINASGVAAVTAGGNLSALNLANGDAYAECSNDAAR